MNRAVKCLAALAVVGAAVMAVAVFTTRPAVTPARPADNPTPEPGPELTLDDLKHGRHFQEPPPREREFWTEERLLKVLANGDCGGTVVAVDSRSITVDGKACTLALGPGEVDAAEEGTFRLVAVGPLARGGFNAGSPGGRYSYGYRLADVRVGDRVVVNCVNLSDGRRAAVDLCIKRRPGGRVPPCPGDDIGANHHERMNAEQDFEEKGGPLPPHLWPIERPKRQRPHGLVS